MLSLQNRLPSTQARQADDLLIEATNLLDQHREITDEEDYNMASALLTSARDFRHDLERKSVIRRSQQSRLYLDKAHETLETVKITLEAAIKIQYADVFKFTVPTEPEHEVPTMGMITGSDTVLNGTVSRSIPAGSVTTASLASNAPIKGPTLQIVLNPPRTSSLPSPPDEQPPQESAAPYDGIPLVPTGVVKETRPSINPPTIVFPLPTPPLTPETPAKVDSAHFASPADA